MTMAALLDHFRPPLSVQRHWHAFHSAWCNSLATHLNERLPTGYFAEPNVQFGIEIDVAAFDEGAETALAFTSWLAPPPMQTIPLALVTDLVEVLVYSQEGGSKLAGAIELVSPANKDRASHREAFVAKCAAYVQQGIGLIIIDVVTDRRANLHTELLAHLQSPQIASLEADIYAAAYRPVKREQDAELQIWPHRLAIGGSLPTLPLWLPGNLCVGVDLAATYERTCRDQRILAAGA